MSSVPFDKAFLAAHSSRIKAVSVVSSNSRMARLFPKSMVTIPFFTAR